MAIDRRAVREHSVLSRLEHFCDEEGLGPASVCDKVTAAFVDQGLKNRTPSTRGTYRSVLRSLAGESPVRAGTPYSASPAPSPYGPDERRELVAIARAQRKPWRARSTLVLVALGIGAGLRSGEITAATKNDVIGPAGSLSVTVGGRGSRTVPVQPAQGALLAELARSGDGTNLFHPEEADRTYYNFVNDFCRGLVRDPGAPTLSANRCRSSFICDHLPAGTPLSVLLEMSGITQVESLLRYARHVDGAPSSKAALRHLLAIQGP